MAWSNSVVVFPLTLHLLNVCLHDSLIINSGQKDVEVFCVALVTYKLTII